MTEIEKFVGGIAQSMQKAVKEAAAPLLQQAQVILDEGSEEQAREFCDVVTRNSWLLGKEVAKDAVTELALKYNIYVTVGDYGNGEFMLHSYDKNSCGSYEVGDWISSSVTC